MDDLLYLYLLKLFHKNAHSFMGFKLLIVPAIQLLAFPFCFISNSLCNVHPLVFFFLGGCFFHVCFVLYRSHLRFCDNGLLMLQFLMWTSVAMMVPFFLIVTVVSRSGFCWSSLPTSVIDGGILIICSVDVSALVELLIKALFGCVLYWSGTLGILIILWWFTLWWFVWSSPAF